MAPCAEPAIGVTSLALAVAANWRNRARDRRERGHHKLTIKGALYDAEAIMRSVPSPSRDCD